MANEFNIKNGFISNSDSRIIGALTANTISATTYFNLPTSTEVFVTGGTYTNGTTVFTNNTGGTFSVTGFNTGTTVGNGTSNYIPKWTGSTGLSNSQIQDNGTSVAINSTPTSTYKLRVYGATNSGVYGETIAGTDKYGVIGANIGDGPGTFVGVYGFGTLNDTPFSNSIYVGGKFLADGSSNNLNYAAWFVDGTEGLNKVLISATSDGKTNWSSSLSGLTNVESITVSATTYYNLPTDVYVTGFTYNNANIFTITNNTGGTLTTTVNTMTGLTVNGNLTVTGDVSGNTNSISSDNLITVALLYLSNNT